MTLDELLIHVASLEDDVAIYKGALKEILMRAEEEKPEAYSPLGQCRAAAIVALECRSLDDKEKLAAAFHDRARKLRADLIIC